MYDWYLTKRDDLVNWIIRFLLKHCCLHASTIRMFMAKVPPVELKIYSGEFWKNIKTPR